MTDQLENISCSEDYGSESSFLSLFNEKNWQEEKKHRIKIKNNMNESKKSISPVKGIIAELLKIKVNNYFEQ